jgi:hypothetical protein
MTAANLSLNQQFFPVNTTKVDNIFLIAKQALISRLNFRTEIYMKRALSVHSHSNCFYLQI